MSPQLSVLTPFPRTAQTLDPFLYEYECVEGHTLPLPLS